MKKISVLLIVLSIFFNACDDETVDTIAGGGRFQVAVTVTPPLNIDGNTSNGIEDNCFFFITTTTSVSYFFKQSSPSYLITDEQSVTKGQTIIIQNFALQTLQSLSCRSVKIDFILNGNIVRTENYNMGYNGSTTTLCADGEGLSSLSYIIP